MADINAGPAIRMEAGGVVRLKDGQTEYTFKLLEPGTLQIEPGGYEPLHYTDRGEQQDALEGDERLTTIRLSIKLTSMDANELLDLASKRDTTTGKMKQFDFEADWPAYKGSTTLHRAACPKAIFSTPPRIRTGVQFDLVEIEMTSHEPLPTYSKVTGGGPG